MGKRGPSPGTGGRPSKPLADKIAEGNPGKRPLKVMGLKIYRICRAKKCLSLARCSQPRKRMDEFCRQKKYMSKPGIGLINADALLTYLRKRWRGMRWLPPDGNIVKK